MFSLHSLLVVPLLRLTKKQKKKDCYDGFSLPNPLQQFFFSFVAINNVSSLYSHFTYTSLPRLALQESEGAAGLFQAVFSRVNRVDKMRLSIHFLPAYCTQLMPVCCSAPVKSSSRSLQIHQKRKRRREKITKSSFFHCFRVLHKESDGDTILSSFYRL